jgi:hypothetical protein
MWIRNLFRAPSTLIWKYYNYNFSELFYFEKEFKRKKIKILIWSKEKIIFILFLNVFFKGKNKHASIKKFNLTSNGKKKNFIYLFPIYRMKKKIKVFGPARGRTQL